MQPHRDRSTPPGEHRAVMLDTVLEVLNPQPGEVAVDCTVGWAGHSAEILRRLGPDGFLIGIDWDADNLPKARARLEAVGNPFHLEHANFAGLATLLQKLSRPRVHMILADLGMSSMQVDDPERGFSYRRDGPLDMRMDRSRGRTAAQLLATMDEHTLAAALRDYGDEAQADTIAAAIIRIRQETLLQRTGDLAKVIQQAVGQTDWQLQPRPGRWNLHPAAKTFQALRILVNRELGNLESLLRALPECLAPGGRAAVIAFHSGEDRRVKAAFRAGRRQGVYGAVAEGIVRSKVTETQANPRARSAKLRWAQAAEMGEK